MAAASTVHLVVSGEVDVDQEELDELTTQLRRRLLELDVDDVRLGRSGEVVPEGAKPGEVIAAGALAVSLAPAVLRPVLRLVETWMQNRPVRTVKVDIDGRTIELGHASAEQQERLVDAFLEDVRTRTPAEGGPPVPDAAAGVAGGSGEPPAVQE
ncbi:hypothetical protein ACFW08_08745 [Streptomyces sp. NPDC058960]|uniref:hypothetical protein n=1 Tax=Streptomyces sp. NPDC058960 TaxID=3346679 RepID=UPI0036BB95CC